MAWFLASVTLTGISTRLLSTRKSAPAAAQANKQTTPINIGARCGITVTAPSPLWGTSLSDLTDEECRKPGTDMNFRRSLPEIRCLSPVCPRQDMPHSRGVSQDG